MRLNDPRQSVTGFLVSHSAWHFAMAVNGALITASIAFALDASGPRLGLTQSALLLPSLLLLLIGGRLADRFDPVAFAFVLHLCSGLLTALFAIRWYFGGVDHLTLLIFGVSMGFVGALSYPVRDVLLSLVAHSHRDPAIARAATSQTAARLLGALSVGAVNIVGFFPFYVFQACIFLFAGTSTGRLRVLSREGAEHRGAGASPEGPIRPKVDLFRPHRMIYVVQAAIGVFQVGPFITILPLLVRDVHHASIDSYTTLYVLHGLGMALGSWLSVRWMRDWRTPVPFLLLLAASGALFGVTGLLHSLTQLQIVVGIWGCMSGLSTVWLRARLQQRLGAKRRGAVLGIYNACFLGGSSLGAAISGLSAGWLAVNDVPLLLSILFLAVALPAAYADMRPTGGNSAAP